MYHIKLDKYYFYSKENIQPYIDQLLIQTKLLQYSIDIDYHTTFHIDFPFTYVLYLLTPKFGTQIYFLLNNSKVLKQIYIDFYGPKIEDRRKNLAKENFQEIFTFLFNKL